MVVWEWTNLLGSSGVGFDFWRVQRDKIQPNQRATRFPSATHVLFQVHFFPDLIFWFGGWGFDCPAAYKPDLVGSQNGTPKNASSSRTGFQRSRIPESPSRTPGAAETSVNLGAFFRERGVRGGDVKVLILQGFKGFYMNFAE